MKTVIVGSDHRGFKLKERIKDEIRTWGYDVVDLGNQKYDNEDDYTDFAIKVGEAVVIGRNVGILICGSGVGMCVAANKVKGVRAGMGISEKQVRLAKEDDDMNVLCLSADFVDEDINVELVRVFLETQFSSEERHLRRVNKIKIYENT